MMHKKLALITFIIFLATSIAVVLSDDLKPTNPICTPPPKSDQDRPAHFLFFIDRTLEASLQSRIVYLLKAISCEIPVNRNIQVIVASFGGAVSQFQGPETSAQVPRYLVGKPLEKDGSTSCDRFRNVLGRAPSTFLEHSNVQFIVPIIDEEPGCSLLKEFQSAYRNDPKKDNFYFNGILINSPVTPAKNQSIRVVIPDLVKTIDPNRFSMKGSENISIVHKYESLVQSYGKMMHDILTGNSVRDWEELETTTSILTTSSESLTSSELPTTSEADDLQELLDFTDDDEANSTESIATFNATTGIVPEKPGTTWSPETETSLNTTSSGNSTENPDYDPDVEYDADELAMMNAMRETNRSKVEVFPTAATKWHWLEPDTLVYILLLLLLILLFCLFLCLVWIFHCADKKKEKQLAEQEEQDQKKPLLLESGSAKGSSAPPTTATNHSDSDEDEEEWKRIKPAAAPSTAPISETESVKQPPVADRYNPVEVSEFEEVKSENEERPRHGYIAPKRAPQLKFDD